MIQIRWLLDATVSSKLGDGAPCNSSVYVRIEFAGFSAQVPPGLRQNAYDQPVRRKLAI